MFKTMHNNRQLIRRKPIIAVIGGAGPDAAIDIQIKLFKTMKEKLNICFDEDHYRVIVDNNIDLPNRDEALLNKGQTPLQMYIQSANSLEKMGADILIISCNRAHAYFEKIQRSTSELNTLLRRIFLAFSLSCILQPTIKNFLYLQIYINKY